MQTYLLRAFNHGSYENLYVIDIWFWIIAKTGNYQLIAGTSVILHLLISLYVLQDYAHSKSFNLRQRVYTLFLLMGLMNFLFLLLMHWEVTWHLRWFCWRFTENCIKKGEVYGHIFFMFFRFLCILRRYCWCWYDLLLVQKNDMLK